MKTLIRLSTEIFDNADLFTRKGAEGEAEEKNGCTYNFNRNTDKLCFKNALARFLRTGTKEDAFDVFFCYSEIFKTFGGYKFGIDHLLELLYQHEANSASLLTKHRDHYSHSVYVFALGISVFTNCEKLRKAFENLYGSEKLYEKFLRYWGLAGLFHDIGYPYEITFAQISEYGKKTEPENENERLKISYTNLEGFTALTEEEVKKCGAFMPAGKKNINSLFASEVIRNFGALTGNRELDEKIVEDCLAERIVKADKYMDHAYFSAVMVLKKLLKTDGFVLDRPTLDAITAILFHNSFYKRTYKNDILKDKYEHIRLAKHPIAYLLMLCDELQCWDRAPYGELSKKQELAWDIDIFPRDNNFDFVYYFAEGGAEDTDKVKNLISEIDKGVVDTSEIAEITVSVKIKNKDKKVYDYFSDGKFINLCKIAETINISYNEDCANAGIKGFMQEQFDGLTLEYKLSNVAQAKNYVRHLQNINCFFSDRQLDYIPVETFKESELAYLAVNEHIRWVAEKAEMGWKYGTDYKDGKERARKRIHKSIIPYDDLSDDEKKKDYFPINNMIKHLSHYGIKVYRMNNAVKPAYILGATGHINLSRIKNFDEEAVRGEVRARIRKLKEKYSLKFYCGLADGADMLFTEEALKCGVYTVAVLPCPWREYIGEHSDGGVRFMRALGQTQRVIVKSGAGEGQRYSGVMSYIAGECDEIFALWDGCEMPLTKDGKPVKCGGTFDTIRTAREKGKTVTLF